VCRFSRFFSFPGSVWERYVQSSASRNARLGSHGVIVVTGARERTFEIEYPYIMTCGIVG
jgi:hypothetical protein